MNKIINGFSVPILESQQFDTHDLNIHLSQNIEKLFANMDNKRLLSYEWNNHILTDNFGSTGYSSFNNASNLLLLPEFNDVFSLIKPTITEFFSRLDFTGKWDFINSWTNVYPQGAYVPPHNHGTAHWSGTYYVGADVDCGDLILTDPKEYALSNEPEGTRYRGNTRITIPVTPGKLIVFPGYLKHESERNQSGADRIVISFNIITHA